MITRPHKGINFELHHSFVFPKSHKLPLSLSGSETHPAHAARVANLHLVHSVLKKKHNYSHYSEGVCSNEARRTVNHVYTLYTLAQTQKLVKDRRRNGADDLCMGACTRRGGLRETADISPRSRLGAFFHGHATGMGGLALGSALLLLLRMPPILMRGHVRDYVPTMLPNFLDRCLTFAFEVFLAFLGCEFENFQLTYSRDPNVRFC